MAASAIHVVPDDSFDDWVVRGDIGNEFGLYARERPPNWPHRRSRVNWRRNSSARWEKEVRESYQGMAGQIVRQVIRRHRPTPVTP